MVLASGGYPGKFEIGKEIHGLEDAARFEEVKVLHAGTKRDGEKIVTSGGRVLGVTADGEKFAGARWNGRIRRRRRFGLTACITGGILEGRAAEFGGRGLKRGDGWEERRGKMTQRR